MADIPYPTEPLPANSALYDGVSITAAPPCARYGLRGRDAALLEAATGLKLPSAIGHSAAGVAKLGPDEWLAILPITAQFGVSEGQPISVVDVSDRSIGIIVEGARAIAILSAGCPLDLAAWPVGRASRTVYELVEVIIFRESETRFSIDIWRSFAPWLWQALCTAAAG